MIVKDYISRQPVISCQIARCDSQRVFSHISHVLSFSSSIFRTTRVDSAVTPGKGKMEDGRAVEAGKLAAKPGTRCAVSLLILLVLDVVRPLGMLYRRKEREGLAARRARWDMDERQDVGWGRDEE